MITGSAWQNIMYGTTTRNMGGTSLPPYDSFNLGLHCGDNPEHVRANRAILAGILPNEVTWLNQVHGTAVVDADTMGFGVPMADAMVSTQKNVVLGVMTADCLPIVIGDTQGEIVGVAHAGWRGLQAGVIENLVKAMRLKKPQAILKVWIGPCISQAAFEVGEDVFNAFVQKEPRWEVYFRHAPLHKYFADLSGITDAILHSLGVEQIEHSRVCTYTQNEKCFSYRRSHPTGRMLTVAWRGGVSEVGTSM